MNRQGPDVGTQYRTAIFFHTPEQEEAGDRLAASAPRPNSQGPIVTEIVPAASFYPAEDYHQRYLEKRGLGHLPDLQRRSCPRPR